MSFQPGAAFYSQGFGTVPGGVIYPHIDVRDPATTDTLYSLGQRWVNTVDNNEWVLTSFSTSAGITSANWAATAGGGVAIDQLDADSGSATPTGGVVTIAGGTGCNTTASGSTVTINVTGMGQEYTVVTADTPMAVNQGYITNKAGTAASMTLPATAVVGASVTVIGLGATGWSIAQNAGQTIHMNSVSTTTGVGGSLASSAQYNTVQLVCVVANTDWVVLASEGVLTVT